MFLKTNTYINTRVVHITIYHIIVDTYLSTYLPIKSDYIQNKWYTDVNFWNKYQLMSAEQDYIWKTSIL